MAYEKQTWVNGETITQEKLNHMEDGIANMGSDAGYECEIRSGDQLLDETVTTQKEEESDPFASARLAYSELIDADVIFVTFDDVDYQFHKVTSAGYPNGFVYGDVTEHGTPIFSEYPFAILSMGSGTRNITMLVTENAGEHTITVSDAKYEVSSVSPCFEAAVEEIILPSIPRISFSQKSQTVNLAPNDYTTVDFSLDGEHIVGITNISPVAKEMNANGDYAFLTDVYTDSDTLHLTYSNRTSSPITTTVSFSYSYIGDKTPR